MKTKFTDMPRREITVKLNEPRGELSYHSHSFGVGGISSLPVPGAVSYGIRDLKPKFIRIFIQEFFFFYPKQGVFDWDKLDAYIDSVHEMGADIMAHIAIKPKALYPTIDENIWMPNNVEEWQNVIKALVKRYSVDKKQVTHWAVANEINGGEMGGCPYKFACPHEYFKYYKMTVEAITKVYPEAKIGGPAWAGIDNNPEEFFCKFLELVKEENLPLDFMSFNCYSDEPAEIVAAAKMFRNITDKHDKNTKLYITELNVALGGVHEEMAYIGARAAGLTAILMALNDSRLLDGTFQYHIMDQNCYVPEFAPFYKITRYMADHWNDYPHKLGLFDWDGNPRPQYFMYKLLYSMCRERVAAEWSGWEYLYTVASRDADERITVLINNYNNYDIKNVISDVKLKNNPVGMYKLTIYRIDDEKRWDDTLNLLPIESRDVYMAEDFAFPVYTPGNSVTLIQISRTNPPIQVS